MDQVRGVRNRQSVKKFDIEGTGGALAYKDGKNELSRRENAIS